MAETGHGWAGFTEHDAAQATTDTNTDTGPELDLDTKSACQMGLTIAGGTGTVDGVLTVYVLGTVDGTLWETTTNGSAWAFTITPIVSTSVYKVFSIDPGMYPKVKIAIENQSGITVTVTQDVNTATVPVAS